jgi:hypothetical protein
MDTNSAVQEAIQKTNSGDLKSAQIILANVLREEPRNARAWYLLSQIVGDRNREIDCLKKVLELEPNSQQAKVKLQKLLNVEHPIQSANAPSTSQLVNKKKKTPAILTILAFLFVVLGISFAALYYFVKNGPDATQCVQVDHNLCLVMSDSLNSHLIGSITNSCNKSITNINLHGSVVNPDDINSVYGEISALQKIVLAPGQSAQFDLVALNTYYSGNLACVIDTKSAYYVK